MRSLPPPRTRAGLNSTLRLALLPLVVLVAGCSFGGTSSATQLTPSKEEAICKIIGTDELKTALGKPLGSPFPANTATASGDDPKRVNCQVRTADEANFAYNLYVDNSNDEADAKSRIGDGINTNSEDPSPKPVSGLGDDARVLIHKSQTTSVPEGEIEVRMGSSLFSVTVDDSIPAPTEALMRDLAGKILARTDLSKVHT